MNEPRPTDAGCANCGAALHGEWCHACGQRASHREPTLRELLHELSEEFVSWDGKYVATVRALFSRPGFLLTEFFTGRRVPWVPPGRLYLAVSLVYFFLASELPALRHANHVGSGPFTIFATAKGDTVITLGTTPPKGRAVSVERTDARESATDARVDGASEPARAAEDETASKVRPPRDSTSRLARAMKSPVRFARGLNESFPRALFLLMPAFALLLWGVYRRAAKSYTTHLYVSVHLHTAVFAYLSLREAVRAGLPVLPNVVGDAVLLALPFWYVPATLQRVYGGGRGVTALRVFALGFAYLFLFAAVVGGLIAMVVWQMS